MKINHRNTKNKKNPVSISGKMKDGRTTSLVG